MSLETAAGVISEPEDLAANTLADCIPFRALVGAANQSAALARIYFSALNPPDSGADGYMPEELEQLRPFVMLWTEEDNGLNLDVVSVGSSWELMPTSGLIVLRLETNVGPGTPSEEDRKIKNSIGQIVKSGDTDNPGLVELSGRGGYLAMRRIRVFGPWRCAEDEITAHGDHFAARIELEWGLRQR